MSQFAYARPRTAALLLACTGAAISCSSASHAGAPPFNDWLLSSDGLWSEPARWSLGVAPGIGLGAGQNARINAIGSPYTVTLNTLAALDNLTLASSDATASVVAGGSLQLAGVATIGDDADPSVGGLLLLNNGAIRGGTWSILGAGELRVRGNQPSRIDDATVLGDVLMETGSYLRVANSSIDRVRMLGNSSVLEFDDNAPIRGTISFEGSGAALRVVRSTSPDGLIHLASDAIFETSDDFAGRAFIGTPSYSTGSLVNDGRITATRGNISLGAASITNNGVMQALNASILTTSASFVNNASLELLNGVFTAGSSDPSSSLGVHNAGAITAVDSTLNIANGLNNSGTIDALRSTVFIDSSRLNSTGRFDLVDSTLRVSGEFALADLGAVTRTNSTIAVAGTLRNENQTLDLGALPDRLALDGGTIRGGSILAWDAALSVSSNLNNALDGVAYSGRLALDQDDAFLRVRNGATIEGLVEMSAGSPEIRFDGSTTLNNITINMSGTQHWFSSASDGQSLTFGPNSVLNGFGVVNGPRSGNGAASRFETLVNEGAWNVRGGYYWQLQNTPNLINRGVITVDPDGELVTSTGLDLIDGQLNIAPDGELNVVQTGSAGPLNSSFFSGGIVNQGIIAIGADLDLHGHAITLNAEHGDVRLGSDFNFFSAVVAQNGAIHLGDGASLALDHGSVTLRDIALTGGVAINQGVQATLTNVTADFVAVRDATVNVTNSEIVETRFDGGTINATDLRDLGDVVLPAFSGGTIRLSAQGGGIANANEFTFTPGSRLTVESPFTGALINRTDWNLTRNARLTLSSDAIVNEADITVALGAQLRVTGPLSFTNPGSITLNGGHLIISSPFEFSELLDDRNDLSNGRVVLDRDIDLAGATLLLRPENGQWALGERKTLSNGVVDNFDGQPLLLLGDVTSFNDHTTLERVDVKGDIVARSIVRIGQDVTFRTLTIEREVIFEQDAAINGMLVQHDNRSVEVGLETSAGGVARIAETGGITANGDSSRAVRISGAPGGSVLENYGDIVVKREGRLDSYDLLRLNNYGSIDIDADADVFLQGLSLLNFGAMRVSSRADVSLSGDLDLYDTSSVVFELGRPSFGGGMFVQGDARLDGSLEITVTEDTSVAVGDQWDLLNTNSVFGAFDSVSFDTLDDPDLRLALLTSDEPSEPNLEVFVRHIADLNADMTVDMDDLNIVLNGYGESGSLLAGDANTDGLVDFHDLNIVLANFGRTFSSRGVPTPGAAAILGIAGLAAGRGRRSALAES